ncbi:MAG: FAD-dependent thymidylate synthase [bacterium]
MSKIFIYDEFNPQDTAMLQALYSRSSKSVEEHVEKVKKTGSGKFMESFYIGYGHKSIADCGSTTLFIEQISILADKALQDWPLYSGQETSTRYVDMAKQLIIDPLKIPESKNILDKWMDFYLTSQETVAEHLIKKYPRKPDEDEAVYMRAIKARVFDSLRCFLPAGITTQLSWHTNLRQAWDKLAMLRYYPLPEAQKIASEIIFKLKEKYPHSFSHKLYEDQEAYWKKIGEDYTYYNPEKLDNNFSYKTNINIAEFEKNKDLINSRPIKTNIPHFITELGNITFEFLLDYGSFRDIQRHRNGVCRMPLLTTDFGFNDWYLDQYPEDVKQKAIALIKEQKILINKLNATPEIKQYYIALGFNVACKLSYGLPAAIYVIELRAGKTVHPSLRKIAHQMHYAMLKMLPGIKLYSDLELDDWDIRRGLHDIREK